MKAWREQWDASGYLVIPGLFDPARVGRLRQVCDRVLEQFLAREPLTGKPGNCDGHCLRHLNHPGYHAGRPAEGFVELMDAAADELLLGVARSILGEPAMFRCTTYWFNPREGQLDGNWHRDSQFVTKSEAEERKFLEAHWSRRVSGIQLQVALAPSDDIEYVPASHLRWDTPGEYAIRRAEGMANNRSNAMPGALRLALQPGDAALFNPDGLHRGRYHSDKLRRTLMLTYTAQSYFAYDYFSHQPWFLEPGYLAPLSARSRSFFEPFMACYRERWLAARQAEAVA